LLGNVSSNLLPGLVRNTSKNKTLMELNNEKSSLARIPGKNKLCLTGRHDKNSIFVFLDLWFSSFICGDIGYERVTVTTTKNLFPTTALTFMNEIAQYNNA
jgi:hypothetical protein